MTEEQFIPRQTVFLQRVRLKKLSTSCGLYDTDNLCQKKANRWIEQLGIE